MSEPSGGQTTLTLYEYIDPDALKDLIDAGQLPTAEAVGFRSHHCEMEDNTHCGMTGDLNEG